MKLSLRQKGYLVGFSILIIIFVVIPSLYSPPGIAKRSGLSEDIITKIQPLEDEAFYSSIVVEIAKMENYSAADLIHKQLDIIVEDGKITNSELNLLRDLDDDYVINDIEIEKNTNPLDAYTSGTILDDFNALYTFEVDPNNPKEVDELLKRIPDVEVRHWNTSDGGLRYYLDKKYDELSLRCPLVQYYSKKAEIKWIGQFIEGYRTAHFYVDGTPIWNGNDLSYVSSSLDQPSYYLGNNRTGACSDSSQTNFAILKLMGYKTIKIGSSTHAWCEALIDGIITVVNFNNIFPRAIGYENLPGYDDMSVWEITTNDYDPEWYLD